MTLSAELIPVDPDAPPADRVNVFIHGYRSMGATRAVEAARARVRRTGVAGENYLLRWMSGAWADSARFASLRAAYRAARVPRMLSPWTILADAGVVGVHEAMQYKLMERRADRVGRSLAARIARVAGGRPVNLVGHSLGARVVHACLGSPDADTLWLHDAVLLAGAADLDAADWPQCVARLDGRVYNAYSPRDRILWMTPDLRRRVGNRPLPQIEVLGHARVINHETHGVNHVQHWTHLSSVLPAVWPEASGPPLPGVPRHAGSLPGSV
ncbi:DUF726 domain-containing protein [Botrimarina sp.]|uniref:DUF726 domain-containing protein n=1 Tax=Botrimarina sp. TaxID=2795802 RepID=UPI0032EB5394